MQNVLNLDLERQQRVAKNPQGGVDSVLDVMYELNQRGGNFHESCARTIIGSIVLMKYNNKTYTIDDIEWNENPSSTFPERDGTAITYNEFYKTHYDLTIHDARQPLLISRASKKDRKAGRTRKGGPYKLIPELCTMTGQNASSAPAG
ncbi:PREDICTED: piwi-like protein 4 [Priapulus caudatus]|uniref:Piwi-like protein 4 n=1 Tax=Priapulus caudatus TaxID=37621 RepID=A0ABM1EKZ8_PRICU|nr:PREDICTED: piwi-like protein 4 [Priapulus caudatus]